MRCGPGRPHGVRATSKGWVERGASALPRAAVLILAGAVPAAASAQQRISAPASLVFDRVTVIDVEQGKLVPDQRVVITGNRIQAIGGVNAVKTPKGAQVVDARGKYLMPGLWDLHVHARRLAHLFYPLLLAHGVTGIRDPGSEVPLDTLRLWRREILAGTRVGPPRQILSGLSLTPRYGSCEGLHPIQGCVLDSAGARRIVDSLRRAGADMIKSNELPRELYFVVAAEARRVGLPFGGHQSDDVSSMEASDSGAAIIDHVDWRFPEALGVLCWGSRGSVGQCQPAAERLAHNGTWLVPTVIRLLTEGAGRAVAGPNSDSIFARFQQRASEFWAGSKPQGNWLRDSAGVDALQASGSSPGVMSLVQRLGLMILAGSDAGAPVLKPMPPGFALHAELAMYVAEGLTPLRALQAATLEPAKFLRATDSLGTVAPGKLADLVLLDANPLADITNTTTTRAVVANGRYFDRAALDGLLAEVQAKAKQNP